MICSWLKAEAQSKDTTISYPQKIKGNYNPVEGTFYGLELNEEDMRKHREYIVTIFREGVGIVECNSYSPQSNVTTYGVMDIQGNLLIPCNYERIYYITSSNDPDEVNPTHFKFERNDSLGIITTNNKVIYSFPKKNNLGDCNFFLDREYSEMNLFYCIIRFGEKFGLVSLTYDKLILPVVYDKMNLFPDYVLCQRANKYSVFSVHRNIMSEEFDLIYICDNEGPFLLQKPDGELYVCNDIFLPWQTPNEEMNQDSVLALRNHYIIVRTGEHLGVLNYAGEGIIPFIYDDIYFQASEHDGQLFWLKKDGKWALANELHALQTEFEFKKIEQLNKINFENFLYLADVDTTDEAHNYALDHVNDFPFHIDIHNLEATIAAKNFQKELNSRVISKYCNNMAEKEDGFHLLNISENDVRIDPLAWDDIYLVMQNSELGCSIGARKGDKFGYYDPNFPNEAQVKYDGIYFDPDIYQVRIYDVYDDPFAIVKGNKVLYRNSYYRTPWWAWLFTYETSLRTRWKKYGLYDELKNK